MKKVFSIFIFSSFFISAFSQNADSLKQSSSKYFLKMSNELLDNSSLNTYIKQDTSIKRIINYFPENFPYSISLSNRKMFFNSPFRIGFNSGYDYLDLFGYNKDAILYYDTRIPYTELFVLFGSKKEQFFRLLHTQNIRKNWNVAVSMLRLRSEGFYQRQNCTDNNLSISTNYRSKNKRYALLSDIYFSGIKTDENGGITNDTAFESTPFINKKTIQIALADARSRRGTQGFYLNQFWYFGKQKHSSPTSLHNTEKDTTSLSDTVAQKSKTFDKKSFLSYSFNINDSWFVYDDKDTASGFYKNIFFDSTKTLDSSNVRNVENKISFNKGICNLSAEHQTIFFKQNTSDTSFYNYILSLKVFPLRYAPDIYGNYIIYGHQRGDYDLNINLSIDKFFPKKPNFPMLPLYYTIKKITAPEIFSSYSSNNFKWKKDFEKVFLQTAGLRFYQGGNNYSEKNFHFDFCFSLISNYIFLDTNILPKQFLGNIQIITASAEKTFRLKKFSFYNKITYQSVSENILRLPEFSTKHSFYFDDKWFNKMMNVQLGFNISFYTSYFADAYMPALGQYYLQNEKKIGSYPFIDFFLNMKIKHANIFFKIEHINSGIYGENYYFTPHYPAPDRSFKVGIKWLFFE
ncbi:MAG: putative porin [Bacteroidota bacterium]